MASGAAVAAGVEEGASVVLPVHPTKNRVRTIAIRICLKLIAPSSLNPESSLVHREMKGPRRRPLEELFAQDTACRAQYSSFISL